MSTERLEDAKHVAKGTRKAAVERLRKVAEKLSRIAGEVEAGSDPGNFPGLIWDDAKEVIWALNNAQEAETLATLLAEFAKSE